MKNIIINTDKIDFNKPIHFYCQIYNLSENAIRNRFKKLKIYHKFTFVNKNSSLIRKENNIQIYNLNPKYCQECKSKIDYSKRENNFCSLKCSATFSQREFPRKMTEQQKRKISFIAKQRDYANNFLKYRQENCGKRREIICPFCKNKFLIYYSERNRKFCSKKCASQGCNKSNMGGLRKNSGRGKQGWYKGFYCQSSWELAWVIYALDNNIQFQRNLQGFEYFFENKKHKYYPDFYLPNENTFLEIKGYPTTQNHAKINQFPLSLKILYKKEMKPILEYVNQKYGAKFISLYTKI